jgi:hypothetical protein
MVHWFFEIIHFSEEMCPATLHNRHGSVTVIPVVDHCPLELCAQDFFQHLFPSRWSDYGEDIILVAPEAPQPVVLPINWRTGFIGMQPSGGSDPLQQTVIFRGKGIPDPEEDVMDSFRADLKPVLVLKGFLDASQDSPLMKFHHRDMRKKADAEITDPRAIRVSRCDRVTAPGADVGMKFVLCDFDLLWWRKVFDRPGLDTNSLSKIGATLWALIHGHRDNFIRFWYDSSGTMVTWWSTTFP